MHIAIIGHGFWPQVGGLERQIYDCAMGFTRRGHRVSILSISGENSESPQRELLKSPNAHPIEVYRFRVPSYKPDRDDPLQDLSIPLAFYKRSASNWAQLIQSADVICTFGVVPGIVGGMIKNTCQTPLVAVLPGIPDKSSPVFEEVLNSKADAFVSVSRYMQEKARALYDLEMINIHNGVDTDFFKPTHENMKYAFLKNVSENLITSPVRLDPMKGIHILIEAFDKVRRSYDKATLLITGNGSVFHEMGTISPYHEYLLNMSERMGLEDHVVFALGETSNEDMPALYTLSSVCVMTSLSEGFGLGIAEAMACETPVVATRTEGMQEVFEDGIGGYYADVGNTDQIAESIIKLLTDSELKTRMGKEAREHILNTYSLNAQIDGYLDLFYSF